MASEAACRKCWSSCRKGTGVIKARNKAITGGCLCDAHGHKSRNTACVSRPGVRLLTVLSMTVGHKTCGVGDDAVKAGSEWVRGRSEGAGGLGPPVVAPAVLCLGCCTSVPHLEAMHPHPGPPARSAPGPQGRRALSVGASSSLELGSREEVVGRALRPDRAPPQASCPGALRPCTSAQKQLQEGRGERGAGEQHDGPLCVHRRLLCLGVQGGQRPRAVPGPVSRALGR